MSFGSCLATCTIRLSRTLFAAELDPNLTEEHFRLTPEPEPIKIVREIPTPPQTSGKKAAKISFEDYHLTWSGIATSKSDKNSKNPCKSFHERFKINFPPKFVTICICHACLIVQQ